MSLALTLAPAQGDFDVVSWPVLGPISRLPCRGSLACHSQGFGDLPLTTSFLKLQSGDFWQLPQTQGPIAVHKIGLELGRGVCPGTSWSGDLTALLL